MSYDINFWRPKRGIRLNAIAIYQRLCRGDEPDELEDLPVKRMLNSLKGLFPEFDPKEKFPLVPTLGGAIEINWSQAHFRFVLHPMYDNGTEADQIVRLMARFGCRCFDPQVGKYYPLERPPRFTEPEEKRRRIEEVEWMITQKAKEFMRLSDDDQVVTRRLNHWMRDQAKKKKK